MSDTIFLIHAHLSDIKRIEICSELIDKLKEFGYEIILTTHTPAPIHIQRKIDYLVYDKDNIVFRDNDDDYKFLGYIGWYTPHFDVQSKEFFTSNTTLAVYRLLLAGISYAKMLEKKIIHIMDYDGLLHKKDELLRNESVIRNGKKGVFYSWNDETDTKNLQVTTRLMSGDVSYMYDRFVKYKDVEQQKKILIDHQFLPGEEFFAFTLGLTKYNKDDKVEDVVLKEFTPLLEEIGLEQDRSHVDEDFPWLCVILKSERTFMFMMNPQNPTLFEIASDTGFHHEKYLIKLQYHLLEIPDNSFITVKTNGKMFRTYDLRNEKLKDKLKLINSLEFKG
jgi:hypothetical protein